jgi:exodeoxyribonuclease V alpha subunit
MAMMFMREGPKAPKDPTEKQISGRVKKVRIRRANDGGGEWLVADLDGGYAVTGKISSPDAIQEGEYYTFLGRWIDKGYGPQFEFAGHVVDVPRTEGGAAKYLVKHCRGCGVGMATARKIVERFGDKAVETLRDNPEWIVEAGLLRESNAKAASESLREVAPPGLADAHVEVSKLLQMAGGGFHRTLVNQILKKWGADAAQKIRDDPFVLMLERMPGCSFGRCDRLYLAFGLPPDNLLRQMLACWYCLQKGDCDGHTWTPMHEAIAATTAQVGGTIVRPLEAIRLGVQMGWISYYMHEDGGHWVAQAAKAEAEADAAEHLVRLTENHCVMWPKGPFPGLTGHQQQQADRALSSPVAFLVGPPGVGKTFAAGQVIAALVAAGHGDRIYAAAPTGKAATRLSEIFRKAGLAIRATTIHSLLKARGVVSDEFAFAHNERCPLDGLFYIVDESSMVDVSLLAALLRALPDGAHVLFVGDHHQLPSVQHGAFLRDAIAAGLRVGELSEILRNQGNIVHACHAIKNGNPRFDRLPGLANVTETDNLVLLPAQSSEEMSRCVSEAMTWLYGRGYDLWDDVQILAVRNATRIKLNAVQQGALNPDGAKGRHRTFRVGDKIICGRNGDYADADSGKAVRVSNGDQGTIERFAGNTMVVQLMTQPHRVKVPFAGGDADKDANDPKGEEREVDTGCNWQLGYCITTHKSQGSEWPVVLFLAESVWGLSSRQLLYTALSRAKKLCIVIGDDASIARFVGNDAMPHRRTFLADKLRKGMA